MKKSLSKRETERIVKNYYCEEVTKMMMCEYGAIDDYKEYTYEELLNLRASVMEDIVAYEEEHVPEEKWMKKPGADYEYRLNLEFLVDLIDAIKKKYLEEQNAMLQAVNAGEFAPNRNECRVSQIKRFTRLSNMPQQSVEGSDVMEFAVNDAGELEAYISGGFVGAPVDMDYTGIYDFDRGFIGGEGNLMLQAECINHKFIGPGSLRKTEWIIYSDGSYQIKNVYNLKWNELENASAEEAELGRELFSSGFMDADQFVRLQKAMNKQDWGKADPERKTRDGSVWQILMYDQDGHVIQFSGEPGSIEGNKVIENIVAVLPRSKK